MSSLAITKATGTELAAGITAREEFGARELMRTAERASVAAAAQAKAEVESRFSMAIMYRRDMDQVRQDLLTDCERPAFARVARFKIPNRGEGWTIRFAEAAVRRMGNVYIPAFVIYEDDERRIMRVTATDLEGNITWPKDVTITKTIERYESAGREVVRTRQTSAGKLIYIVRATDEELTVKENSLVSKTARTNALRLIPPDLLDECLATVQATLAKAPVDPDADRKRIADGFATLGIQPKDLKEYLGVELGQLTAPELEDLRQLYTAIKEGHIQWREVLADKRQERANETGTDDSGKKGSSALKEKLGKRATAKPVVPEVAELPEITPDTSPGQQVRRNGELFEVNEDATSWSRK